MSLSEYRDVLLVARVDILVVSLLDLLTESSDGKISGVAALFLLLELATTSVLASAFLFLGVVETGVEAFSVSLALEYLD